MRLAPGFALVYAVVVAVLLWRVMDWGYGRQLAYLNGLVSHGVSRSCDER